MLQEAQNALFYDYITSLNRHDNSIWRQLKSASKPLSANPPIRTQTPTPGPWARSNKEKAVFFAEHLAAVFTPNGNIHSQEITNLLDHAQEMDEPATVLTPKEIKKEISYLNNKKAPGLDQISAKMQNSQRRE
jgi:hypothetical protein